MRLAAAPVKERQRVTAPMAVRQRQASNVGVYTVAGRRMARKTWLAVSGSGPEPESGGGPAPAVIAAIQLAPILVREPAVPPPPPPPQDAAAIPTGAFTPRFSRPMSEPLAERFPELMLPGLGSIPAEGVALVETNEAFVEAFLLGANQELNYELLWRGLPSDRRATAFRRFWGRTDDGDDIDHVSTWTPDSAVGSHTTGAASMVLLVRGELVRRYPSMTIATLPAAWNTNESRSPVADAAQLRRPAFRGRIGEDVLYAGFAGVTPTEAVGTPVKADNKPGLFFLLAENPGDPRFGLDPDGGTTPPTRATLSWAQLTLPAGASYATLPAFPVVPDAGFNPATATRGHAWPISSGSVPSGPSCTRRSWCDPPPDACRSDPPAAVLRSRHHRDRDLRRRAARARRGHTGAGAQSDQRAGPCPAAGRHAGGGRGAHRARDGAAHARSRAAARSRGRVHDQRPARRDPGIAGAEPVPGDAGSAARSRPAAHPRLAGRDLHVHARSTADATRGRGRAAGTGARRRWPRTRPNRGRHGGRWRR